MKLKKQKFSEDFKSYNVISNELFWKQDPKGYFLIRINREEKKIELAFVKNNHEIQFEIIGKKPRNIYFKILNMNLGLRPEHYSYLGSELEKAYLALKLNIDYIQDSELEV